MPRAKISAVRPRGQPRKPAEKRRTRMSCTRLLESEHGAFTRACSELGETNSRVQRRLIREFTMRVPDYFGSEVRALRAGCDGLARAGNNLNQLTKLAHQGEWPADDSVLKILVDALGAVEELQASFSESVRRVVERRL